MRNNAMRISVIASLIVAVHLGVIMMVVSPGCATVKREPPVAQPGPAPVQTFDNLPDIPPMPPEVDAAPVETSLALPPVVSQVDVPQAPAPAGDNIYVVQKGDSLSKIAARHGVKTADILALNNITDPNKIFVGQKLLLPAYATPSQSKPSAAPAEKTPAVSTNASGQTEYVVQRGDALSKIAKKFGVTQAAIMAANGIKDPNKIFAGKKLVIPAAGEAAPAAAPAEKAPEAPATPAADAEPAVEAAPADIVPEVAAPAEEELVGCIPYHAVAGDTVDSIVSTFAVDRATFLRINRLSPNAVIEPNAELLIPPMGQ